MLQLPGSVLRRKSLTPILERNLPFIKKLSPESAASRLVSPPVAVHSVDADLKDIHDKFADSPDQTNDHVVLKTLTTHHEIRTRKKFEIDAIKLEKTVVKVETESETVTAGPSAEVVPRTLKRGAKKIKKEAADASVVDTDGETGVETKSAIEGESDGIVTQEEPITPTRSTRRSKKGVQSPARDSTAPITPTRLSRRLSKVEKTEELEEISVKSPRKFTHDAKEAVQESLIQISQEIKVRSTSSGDNLTKIKDKTVADSTTENVEAELNDENVPVTPTRTRRKKSEVTTDSTNIPKATTPRRGRKKTDHAEESDNVNNSAVVSQTTGTEITDQVKKTPTRGRRKKEESVKETVETTVVDSAEVFGITDIPEDIENETDAPSTPSRRRSLGRSCKTDIPEGARTPTRRQSLGRSRQEGTSPEPERPKTPTRRKSVGRVENIQVDKSPVREQAQTPTRRQSLGRNKKEVVAMEVESTEAGPDVEQATTPTRRGRPAKNKEATTEIEDKVVEEPLTPSRRGGRPKKATETVEKAVETPTRRGRPKKTESSPEKESVLTPSRRGRPKNSDPSPEKTDNFAVTPSRKVRSKVTDTESKVEIEKPVATTPRRGRKAKSAKSESEEEGHVEEKVTPSRRKKTKREEKEFTTTSQDHTATLPGKSLLFCYFLVLGN